MRRLLALFVIVGSLAVGPASSATVLAAGETTIRPAGTSGTSVRVPVVGGGGYEQLGRYWS